MTNAHSYVLHIGASVVSKSTGRAVLTHTAEDVTSRDVRIYCIVTDILNPVASIAQLA